MTDGRRLHLFEGFGVELEYVIVRADTLDVLPICDRLMQDVTGEAVAETEQGDLAWSNELVLHVVELKTNGPAASLAGLATKFQADVRRIDALLAPHDGRLMPCSMHPWMDPLRETKLWPHEYGTVYRTFDRIFGCQGHGWSNITSTHLNLPFADDCELGRLHAAVRLVLPLLPALAASSPVVEGRIAGAVDARLGHYRTNARAVPSVTGDVVPERAWTRESYERDVLGAIYRDLAPYDPEGVLRHEWVNARGAIARFDRHSIEIRLLDIQECPKADLAILALVAELVRAFVEERWYDLEAQQAWEPGPLDAILKQTAREGEEARITNRRYLEALGLAAAGELGGGDAGPSAGDVWRALRERLLPPVARDRGEHGEHGEHASALDVILEHGPVARRLLRALGRRPSRGRMAAVWKELCDCLEDGRLFIDAP